MLLAYLCTCACVGALVSATAISFAYGSSHYYFRTRNTNYSIRIVVGKCIFSFLDRVARWYRIPLAYGLPPYYFRTRHTEYCISTGFHRKPTVLRVWRGVGGGLGSSTSPVDLTAVTSLKLI